MIDFTKFLEAYNDNRSGFAKKRREDDEYHTPDPTTRTHKVSFDVSKDGGEKHNRTVTIQHSTKTPEEAKKTARAHLEKQGYKIHEEVINEDAYEKAEENKKSADSAKKQGDMFAHHMHMADHHDNMAEWHGSKGRHGEADKHAEKAEQHHEKAMALKESVELDEANTTHQHHVVSKLDGNVLASYKTREEAHKNAHGNKVVSGSLETIGDHQYVKEETEEQVVSEAAKGHTIEAHGLKGMKRTPWRKTFKSHDHLHDWADKNDSVEIHGTRDLEGVKKKTNEEVGGDEESNTIEEVRMTAAMKLQKAFQREQEKRQSEKKAGEELLKKPVKEDLEKCPVCNKNPCWCDDSHGFVEGKKPDHLNPGWMLKVDPVLAKKVADNKKKFKSFKDTVGKKIETK